MTASTDHGTVLPPGSWAIIWNDHEEGYQLLVPKMEKGAMVPNEGQLLTACMVRLGRDEQFRDELLEWFQALRPE